jgi:hypothetical protein
VIKDYAIKTKIILSVDWLVTCNKIVIVWLISFNEQMKKKNGLLQTFFYGFLKIQVTNCIWEILVTFENQLSIIYWFLLRYTVIIYKFTQGNLGANKIARSQFQPPVKKKNRKLRHWRPTARSLDNHQTCKYLTNFITWQPSNL